LSKRQKALWKRKQELRESSSVESPHDPVSNASLESEEEQLSQKRSQFLQKLQHVITLDRQLGLLDLFQWLLFWLLIVGWYTGLFQLLSRIPILAQYRYSFLGIPVKLLLIWFFTGLAIRLSRGLIDKVRTSWENNNFTRFIHLGDAQRSKLRTETITSAVKGLATVIIATTGLLAVLSILRIPTGSVLAIGGLLGLAISFGSQNLMNDLVNGFLILAEDQYAIGDVVDLGTAAGLVENLNLRVTQLRSGGGELVTIPNSIIRDVKNLTRSWSRVNFTIDVAYDTDPEKALSVLKQTAQGLYDDPEWHGKIVAPPDVLGIDNVSHSGLSLTTWIKTAPGEHWSVGREFRFRVRKALEANGIEIGVPQQTHIMETPHSETSSKT
jgi:small conductance mechanosensitive channel